MSATDVVGYCSWCFLQTEHALMAKRPIARHVYECRNCGHKTLRCRACHNMTRGGKHWNNELCAEHSGEIASFARLSLRLSDIEDFGQLFKRDSRNIANTVKIGVGMAGGACIASPLALATLPTLATVSAIGGLGTMLATASGAALGGYYGGAISNSYFGQIRNFNIRKKSTGSNQHAVICINGLLSEKNEDFEDWEEGLADYFQGSSFYHVDWEAANLSKLGRQIMVAAPETAGLELARNLTTQAALSGLKKAAPMAGVLSAAKLIANPWHSAMVKAEMTGILLADVMARTPEWTFSLVGHSLGVRVMYFALQALARTQRRPIENVYCLGGAVGRGDAVSWCQATKPITGRIYNAYSKRDKILRYLYKGANLGLSDPIGYNAIVCDNEHIVNIDCSELVSGHMAWKGHFAKIMSSAYRRRHARTAASLAAEQASDKKGMLPGHV